MEHKDIVQIIKIIDKIIDKPLNAYTIYHCLNKDFNALGYNSLLWSLDYCVEKGLINKTIYYDDIVYHLTPIKGRWIAHVNKNQC